MSTDFSGNGMRILYVAVTLLSVVLASAASVVAEPGPAVPDDTQPVRIVLTPPKTMRAPVSAAEIPQTAATRVALERLLAEHRCLAEVMYYEARGEGEDGQTAVARVVLNRLASGNHGNTICAVAYEGAHQTFCQFTFVCDGSLDQPKRPEAWRSAQVLAARIMTGQVSAGTEADDATYYHNTTVRPTWAPKMLRLARIGNHIFYRAPLPKAKMLNAAFRGSLQ
jgi:spore germination cell wall hydrolase CwlJ-like protein